jgi:hypothetical protein
VIEQHERAIPGAARAVVEPTLTFDQPVSKSATETMLTPECHLTVRQRAAIG